MKIESEVEIKVESKIKLELSESEARALNAITVYGSDQFLEFFYKNLGSSYLKEHEAGLRSLFDFVRKYMDIQLAKIDSAHKRIK